MTNKTFESLKGQFQKTGVALFVFLLLSTTASFAAPTTTVQSHEDPDARTHGLGVAVGEVLLLGDFSKKFSDSMGFNLNYDYEASEMFGLHVTANYSNHDSNTGNNDTLLIRGISPMLKANFAYFDKLALYGLVGLGLFNVNQKIGTDEASATNLGFNLGGGFNLNLHRHFAFGTQLSMHNIITKTVGLSNNRSTVIGGTYVGLFVTGTYYF